MGLDIEFSEERKEKADLQIDVVGSIEKKVKSTLHNLGYYFILDNSLSKINPWNIQSLTLLHKHILFLVSILVDTDETHKPTLVILSLCKKAINEIYDRLANEDIEQILEVMEEQDFKPEGIQEDDTFK